MDIRVYYQKIRQMVSSIPSEHVVVVSVETSDGGRGNVKTEVSRETAARLMVEGKARLSSDTEAAEFRSEIAEQRRKAEEEEASHKVQVTLISDTDLKALKGASKQARQ
jgi:hypothetical protein